MGKTNLERLIAALPDYKKDLALVTGCLWTGNYPFRAIDWDRCPISQTFEVGNGEGETCTDDIPLACRIIVVYGTSKKDKYNYEITVKSEFSGDVDKIEDWGLTTEGFYFENWELEPQFDDRWTATYVHSVLHARDLPVHSDLASEVFAALHEVETRNMGYHEAIIG